MHFPDVFSKLRGNLLVLLIRTHPIFDDLTLRQLQVWRLTNPNLYSFCPGREIPARRDRRPGYDINLLLRQTPPYGSLNS